MFKKLIETSAPLARLAPHLDMRLMLSSDGDESLVVIRDGLVTDVVAGPHVMVSWDTRIAASAAEWAAFLAPVPAPGHHDLFALLSRDAVTFDGNLQPLMANLYFIKLLLASLRPAATQEVAQ